MVVVVIIVDVVCDVIVVGTDDVDTVVVTDDDVVAVVSDVIVVGTDDVDIVVIDGDGVGVVVFAFLGARITNFNTRENGIINIIRTIKQMKIIVTQRRCQHLRRSIF